MLGNVTFPVVVFAVVDPIFDTFDPFSYFTTYADLPVLLLESSVISVAGSGAFQFVPALIFTVTPIYFPTNPVPTIYSASVAPLMLLPLVAVAESDVHH